MPASNWIEEKLIQEGYRITGPREYVVDFVLKKKGIFSVKEILQKNKKLDKVSVYRTIDLLTSLDIIHPTLMLDGHQMYELHAEKHHHHIICTKCKKDECVPCAVTVPKKIKGFSEIHHEVHFTGVCTSCVA